MTPAELLPQVYAELRRLAAGQLAGERDGHTLDATALVHEAFLKLGGERSFTSPADYLRAAAQAMRRILVDHARARNAAKRGGGAAAGPPADLLPARPPDDRLPELSDALDALAATHPQHAELVALRVFAGLTADRAAAALGVSPATGDRMWAYARARLSVALGGG